MKLLFVDEKGPQNTYKKSNPFDMENKLKQADDNMHVYAADVIMIDSEIIDEFEKNYILLENYYLKNRPQFQGELKGMNILRNKYFRYGIASLKNNGLKFYNSLFDLLIKYEVDNLFFTISKMSIVIDSKLNEWILDIGEEKEEVSSVLLKYILTKYAEIEASEEVIDTLIDDKSEVTDVLMSIKNNIEQIIEDNINNKRMMRTQIPAYKCLIKLIDYAVDNMVLKESMIENEFSWTKFMWALDLWLTEKYSDNDRRDKIIAKLDEGISKKPFEKLKFKEIHENCKSEEHVGLRAVDMIVVIIGKMISKLTEDTKYDFNKPDEPRHLPEKWFDLSESQFNLIKKMEYFLFPENTTYVYIVDTYFDEGVLFQTYINYIASFEKFTNYNHIGLEEHVMNHFSGIKQITQYKFCQAQANEENAINQFGTYRKSITEGIVHPL